MRAECDEPMTKHNDIAAAAKRMMARHEAVKQQRPRTQLLSAEEGQKLHEKNEKQQPFQRQKQPPKQKYRIVTETVVIGDKEYTHKVFIPLQSKRVTFMKALNKKTVMPSTAIGK